jgi:hypothetical protein
VPFGRICNLQLKSPHPLQEGAVRRSLIFTDQLPSHALLPR